jgi:hypothetical protein
MLRSCLIVFGLLALLRPGAALGQLQGGPVGRYEALYGQPVDVSVDDLIRGDFSYDGRAVRTRGRLEPSQTMGNPIYGLRGSFGGSLLILPVSEVSFEFEQRARNWVGQELEVTGVFHSSGVGTTPQARGGYVQFWGFVGPPEDEPKGKIDALELRLEALVTDPGGHDGRTVRVVGKFRGRNLYGDLPSRSGRRRSDWVIKDDVFAVWVSGKKPEGDGWKLDPTLRRDTGKWIEVIGRPETLRGVTYIQASRVALTTRPTPTADVAPPPSLPAPPKRAPVVVFSLPLDGDYVPPDSLFQVQFSKDMVVDSFKGRVVFRYAGPRLPGDPVFDAVSLIYDGGRRALTVDPGDRLRMGRVVEILLLPGIEDIEGLTLEPRPGMDEQVPGAVDVLRFEVGAQT